MPTKAKIEMNVFNHVFAIITVMQRFPRHISSLGKLGVGFEGLLVCVIRYFVVDDNIQFGGCLLMFWRLVVWKVFGSVEKEIGEKLISRKRPLYSVIISWVGKIWLTLVWHIYSKFYYILQSCETGIKYWYFKNFGMIKFRIWDLIVIVSCFMWEVSHASPHPFAPSPLHYIGPHISLSPVDTSYDTHK